jgi:hypothetical protein
MYKVNKIAIFFFLQCKELKNVRELQCFKRDLLTLLFYISTFIDTDKIVDLYAEKIYL